MYRSDSATVPRSLLPFAVVLLVRAVVEILATAGAAAATMTVVSVIAKNADCAFGVDAAVDVNRRRYSQIVSAARGQATVVVFVIQRVIAVQLLQLVTARLVRRIVHGVVRLDIGIVHNEFPVQGPGRVRCDRIHVHGRFRLQRGRLFGGAVGRLHDQRGLSSQRLLVNAVGRVRIAYVHATYQQFLIVLVVGYVGQLVVGLAIARTVARTRLRRFVSAYLVVGRRQIGQYMGHPGVEGVVGVAEPDRVRQAATGYADVIRHHKGPFADVRYVMRACYFGSIAFFFPTVGE